MSSTLHGVEGTDITGVHTLILVVEVASDHIEVCWVSAHWHQDQGCVAPNAQKREICWHYSGNETSLQAENPVELLNFRRSMEGSLVVSRDLQKRDRDEISSRSS